MEMPLQMRRADAIILVKVRARRKPLKIKITKKKRK